MRILFILALSIFMKPALGQIQEFHPIVTSYPEIDPDTLRKYETLKLEYLRYDSLDLPVDSLSKEARLLFDSDEHLLVKGPFSTGFYGCSWYCATSPTKFESTTNLKSNKVSNYKVDNIHDFDLKTAWVEGKPDYGIGEEISIEFELFPELKLTALTIYNGYCKSEKIWKENSRVKTFAVYVNNEFIGNLCLEDTYKGQYFEIGSFGGDITLTLRIIEVYPGTKYMDTAISEINFDGTGDH